MPSTAWSSPKRLRRSRQRSTGAVRDSVASWLISAAAMDPTLRPDRRAGIRTGHGRTPAFSRNQIAGPGSSSSLPSVRWIDAIARNAPRR